MAKSPDAFRTISEVADWLGVQAHVLRFWESKFTQVKPVKRAGGRRYYRPADMLLLGGIKKLLHDDGLTIKGVQKILREQGIAHVSDESAPLDDLTIAQLDGELGKDPVTEDAVVLPFHTASERTAPQAVGVAEDPVAEATPSEPAESSEPTQADAPAPAPEPIESTPSSAPSFRRAPDPAATEPARPKPRIIDMPDTPDSEIIVPAGVLARISGLRQIPAAQIAPMRDALARLHTLHTRLSGTGKE
jgi:DNA-binding transcriptional MerR regulator